MSFLRQNNINMNDSQNKDPILGLELTLLETKSTGKLVIDCETDTNHYRGFIEERQEQTNSGTTWMRKFTRLKLCNWKDCRRCQGTGIKGEILI